MAKRKPGRSIRHVMLNGDALWVSVLQASLYSAIICSFEISFLSSWFL